jgi:hypothetical protein
MDLGIGPQGRFKVSTLSALLDKGFYRTPTTYITHIRAHRPFGYLEGNQNDLC